MSRHRRAPNATGYHKPPQRLIDGLLVILFVLAVAALYIGLTPK